MSLSDEKSVDFCGAEGGPLVGAQKDTEDEQLVAQLIQRRMDHGSARVLVEALADYVRSWLNGDFGDPSTEKSLIDMLAYALIKRNGALMMSQATIERRKRLAVSRETAGALLTVVQVGEADTAVVEDDGEIVPETSGSPVALLSGPREEVQKLGELLYRKVRVIPEGES